MEWLESLGLFGLFLGTLLAATIFPFSSDALYIAILAATKQPIACLIVGSLGNWIGGVICYYMGYLGKWEWLEKWTKTDKAKLEKYRSKCQKYGVWLALLCWVPFIGDIYAIALGFFRTKPSLSLLLMFIGKFLRFVCWNLFFL